MWIILEQAKYFVKITRIYRIYLYEVFSTIIKIHTERGFHNKILDLSISRKG